MNIPLPHDDSYEPTETESRASLTLGRAWFHEYDELPDRDYELSADQQDDGE